MKENDWFLETINNPTFTNTEFKEVGINASNTSLEDINVYKNNLKIREHFSDNGKFDEVKFNAAYQNALISYNQLATDTWELDAMHNLTYSRNNVFVEPELRRKGPDVWLNWEGTPFRGEREITLGIVGVNEIGMTGRSMEEVAQTRKVFDPETGTWSDSPNDDFFANITNTRVIASWDFDADVNGNPTDDPDKIYYHKGEAKFDEFGMPYYENLNGRSIVGKLVLHLGDVLTTDGSMLNKIDFFDSDDLPGQKSTFGVLMKNLVTIAPALIPGVAPWYLGMGVALGFSEMFITGAKMFMGSENSTLNNMEGFLESLHLSPAKSESKSAWTINNFIDLGGDVFMLLAQLRWLFKSGAMLLSGGKGIDEATLNALKAKRTKEYIEAGKQGLHKAGVEENSVQWVQKMVGIQTAAGLKAATDATRYMKAYAKLGEELSRIYMVGITTADGYNQAKLEGLSDTEAALFTLGYAVGEYGILKTDIGKWVMPELKLDTYKLNTAIKTIAPKASKTATDLATRSTKEVAKLNKFKKFIAAGVQRAKIENKIGKPLANFALANAMAEGVEETTEELLLDVSKALFNAAAYLRGDESRFKLFENMFDRYTMSFAGGMLGGGSFSLTSDIKNAYRYVHEMDHTRAILELSEMLRNGEKDKIIRQINKLPIAPDYLSNSLVETDKGVYNAPGTDKDNLNRDAKTALITQIEVLDSIIKANGLKKSNNELLDAMTMNEWRFAALTNSTLAGRFILDYLDKMNEIIQLELAIRGGENNTAMKMLTGKTDKKERAEENVEEKVETAKDDSISEMVKRRDELKKEIQSMLNGELSKDYIMKAIFEVNTKISDTFVAGNFELWVQLNSGKKLSEIGDAEALDYARRYKEFLKGDKKNLIDSGLEILNQVLHTVSPLITPEFLSNLNSDTDLIKKIKFSIGKISLSESIEELQLNADVAATEIYGYILEALGHKDVYDEYLKSLEELVKVEDDLRERNDKNLQKINELRSKLIEVLGKIDSETDAEKLTELASEKTGLLESLEEAREENEDILADSELLQRSNLELQTTFNTLIYNLLQTTTEEDLLTIFGKVDYSTKLFVVLALNNLGSKYADEAEFVDFLDSVSIINNLSENGIEYLLNSFGITVGSDINVGQLLHNLDYAFVTKTSSLDLFSLEDSLIKAINNALNLIKLVVASLNAMRIDGDVDTIHGYTAIYNELYNEESKLSELDKSQVDPIGLELLKLAERLEYYKELSNLNKGQKLKIQQRVGVNTVRLLFKQVDKLRSLLSGWDGLDELENAINNATLLKSSELEVDMEALERERASIELALHNILNNPKNLSKLLDLNTMSNIFSLDNYKGFIAHNEESLTESSTSIDDNSFFWWVAAIAAVNPSDYNALYKEKISSRYAPITPLEIAAFVGYAKIQNKSAFLLFRDILGNTLVTLGTARHNKNGLFRNDTPKDSLVYPRFGDVLFIEGVPGAGKSTAVWSLIYRMLGSDHPVFKKVWSVHSSVLNAIDSANNIGMKIDKAFTRITRAESGTTEDGLLNRISNDYLSTFTQEGDFLEFDGSQLYEKDGVIKTKFTTVEDSDPPTLIVIDEISLWSTFDMDVVMDYARKHNVEVVVLGDLQQTSLLAGTTSKVTIGGITGEVNVEIGRNTFIRSPKQGVSMRAGNTNQVWNFNVMQTAINKGEYPKAPLHYNWAEDELFGFQVFTPNSPEVEGAINKMVNSLKDGETIGYVYENESDATLLPKMRELEASGKVKIFKGSTNSGVEVKYFITQIVPSSDTKTYLKKVYTGISRAIYGGLVIDSYGVFKSVDSGRHTVESYSEAQIVEYAENRKKVLDAVYPTGNPIEYKPITHKELVPEPAEDPEEDPEIKGTSEVKESKKRVKNLMNLAFNHQLLLGWSFNTNLLTTMEQAKALTGADKERIDGLIGLERVCVQYNLENFNSKSKDEQLKLLKDLYYLIKSYLRYKNDLGDIAEDLRVVLPGSNIKVDIAYKSLALKDYKDRPNKFKANFEKESISVLHNPSAVEIPPRKQVVAIISLDGNEAIEIPLYTLNNWKALLPLRPIVQELYEDNRYFKSSEEYKLIPETSATPVVHENIAFAKYLQRRLEESTDPDYKNILNSFIALLRMYTFGGDGVFYLSEDDAAEFVKNRVHTGPIIVSKEIMNDEGFAPYTPERTPIKNYLEDNPLLITSNPMALTTTLYEIPAGKRFILVSDDLTLNKEDLWKLFVAELSETSKSVSVIWLNNPVMPIKKYFEYLKGIDDRTRVFNKDYATETTNFRLAYNIAKILSDPKTSSIYSQDSDLTYSPELLKKIYEVLKPLYELMYNSDGSPKLKVEERLSILREKNDEVNNLLNLAVKYPNMTLKGACTIFISDMINTDKFGHSLNIDNLISEILKAPTGEFKLGIFIQLPLEKSKASGVSYVNVDMSKITDWKYDGYDITITGKLDVGATVMPMHLIYKTFTEQAVYDKSDPFIVFKSKLNNRYVKGKLPLDPLKSIKDRFKRRKWYKNIENLTTEEEIRKVILDNRYAIFGDNLSSAIISSKQLPSNTSGTHYFKLLGANTQEYGYIDSSGKQIATHTVYLKGNKITYDKIVSESTNLTTVTDPANNYESEVTSLALIIINELSVLTDDIKNSIANELPRNAKNLLKTPTMELFAGFSNNNTLKDALVDIKDALEEAIDDGWADITDTLMESLDKLINSLENGCSPSFNIT